MAEKPEVRQVGLERVREAARNLGYYLVPLPRQTYLKRCCRGHSLVDPANVYKHNGKRHCRACRRLSARRARG